MYKKIICPSTDLHYRLDGFENIYLINEGDRSLSLFALPKNQKIPTQISPQNICFYIIEGNLEISMDEKVFDIKAGEMLLVPKTSAYTIKVIENTKTLIIRM